MPQNGVLKTVLQKMLFSLYLPPCYKRSVCAIYLFISQLVKSRGPNTIFGSKSAKLKERKKVWFSNIFDLNSCSSNTVECQTVYKVYTINHLNLPYCTVFLIIRCSFQVFFGFWFCKFVFSLLRLRVEYMSSLNKNLVLKEVLFCVVCLVSFCLNV